MADYLLDLNNKNMKDHSQQRFEKMKDDLEIYKAQCYSEAEKNVVLRRRNKALEQQLIAKPQRHAKTTGDRRRVHNSKKVRQERGNANSSSSDHQ